MRQHVFYNNTDETNRYTEEDGIFEGGITMTSGPTNNLMSNNQVAFDPNQGSRFPFTP